MTYGRLPRLCDGLSAAKNRSRRVKAHNVAADDPIVKEIFVEASPEFVFPYLTISDKYAQWMGLAAEIDARPGGVYQFTLDTLEIITGEFLEVTPFTRIVFTWGWKEPDHAVPAGSTRVEIDLKACRDGTLLRVTHIWRVPNMKARDENILRMPNTPIARTSVIRVR